jgi:hypothetical protein
MGARLAAEAKKGREQLTGRHKIAANDLFVVPTISFKLLHGPVIPLRGRRRATRDLDSKHQQFAVDPRWTSQRVLVAHTPDQRSHLGVNPWTAADSRSPNRADGSQSHAHME